LAAKRGIRLRIRARTNNSNSRSFAALRMTILEMAILEEQREY
jgi:hypothetical protein